MFYLTKKKKYIINSDDNFKSLWIQCVTSLGMVLIQTSASMCVGYSAVLLPELEKSDEWEIDDNSSSWIVSIAALPMSISCIFGGILIEKIGRKSTMILTAVICTFGWILIYFCSSMTPLMIGRFLTGSCMGLLGASGGTHIAETSNPKYRGFLMSVPSVGFCFGVFLTHIIGRYIDWRTNALISAIISAASLILIFVPESPTYLVNIGQIEKATQSFYTYRGRSKSSDTELAELIQRQHELRERNTNSLNLNLIISDMMKPEFYKPILITAVFFWTSQWSGNNAITFYTMQFISQTVGKGIDNFLAMIIIDLIRLFMSVLACFFIRMFSRRFVVLSTGFCITASLLLTTVYLFLAKSYPLERYSYIPLIGLVGYVSFLFLGFLPTLWVMQGEVFSQSQRGLGCGMSSFVCYIWSYCVVKTAPIMMSDWGIDTTFLIYTLSGLVGTVVLCVVLPETKDKPLHEIEDRFKKKQNVILEKASQ